MVVLSNPVVTYRRWWREDRISTRVFLHQQQRWIVALLAINYLDYLTTLIAINMGFRELNPVQGFLMQYPVFNELQKLIALPIMVILLIGFFNARAALWLTLVASGFVVLSNIQGLIYG